MLNLDGLKKKQNFVTSEHKLTNFFVSDVEQTIVENTVFRLAISPSIPEIYAIKL